MPTSKPIDGTTENQDQMVAVCSEDEQGIIEDTKEMSEENTVEEIKYETGSLDVHAEIKAVAEEGEAEGVFTGYGSMFGNTDLGDDVVVKGAFTKSLKLRGAKGVKLLYQHRSDEPIGIFEEIVEDEKGLKVKGRLAMGTQRGREVYELMKMGALDGLSIGFRVDAKGMDYDRGGKRRLLKEVDLLEISAVTFPMNPRATIQQVKGADRTVREWEELLRDAGNLSRSESKMAANAVAKALDQRDAGDTVAPETLDALTRLTSILKS